MEFTVRNKTNKRVNSYFRIAAIAILIVLFIVFISKLNNIRQVLLNIDELGTFMPALWWNSFVKFVIYCVHILINFLLLWAITNRFSYSILLVYVAFTVLVLGMILVALRDLAYIDIPLSFIALFVKIIKSPIILFFFVAGHIVRLRINEK